MPQFTPMESLFYGTFGYIGALAAILELNKYVEPSTILAGRELTQHRPKKVIVYTISNLYVKHLWCVLASDYQYIDIYVLYMPCKKLNE